MHYSQHMIESSCHIHPTLNRRFQSPKYKDTIRQTDRKSVLLLRRPADFERLSHHRSAIFLNGMKISRMNPLLFYYFWWVYGSEPLSFLRGISSKSLPPRVC